MATFDELFKQVYLGDPDKAVDDMMGALKFSARQREVAKAPFRAYVAQLLRNEAVRQTAVALGVATDETSPQVAQRAYSAKSAEAPMPVYTPPRPQFTLTLPALRGMLSVEFVVAGRRTTWGDATVSDHEAAKQARRIDARTNLIAADRHDQAIATLRAAKVNTLNELFARDQAA